MADTMVLIARPIAENTEPFSSVRWFVSGWSSEQDSSLTILSWYVGVLVFEASPAPRLGGCYICATDVISNSASPWPPGKEYDVIRVVLARHVTNDAALNFALLCLTRLKMTVSNSFHSLYAISPYLMHMDWISHAISNRLLYTLRNFLQK